MELIEAIRSRVSVRDFADREIPDEVIVEMLDAARLAPSGNNRQDWAFGVVKDAELRAQLAHAAGDQMWIASAPVVIALCADISRDIRPANDPTMGSSLARFGRQLLDCLNDCPDRKAVNKLFANATPLVPGEHMFLVAVSHGLSGCFVGHLDTQRAGEILRLPEHLACLYLLPVGYPADAAHMSPRAKKSIDEVSFVNTWLS
ncbi:MAG: nitroreductase family protein [Micrococcales bacterium]|nr:nitroreductase family protein [Micrococcales bacterium]